MGESFGVCAVGGRLTIVFIINLLTFEKILKLELIPHLLLLFLIILDLHQVIPQIFLLSL